MRNLFRNDFRLPFGAVLLSMAATSSWAASNDVIAVEKAQQGVGVDAVLVMDRAGHVLDRHDFGADYCGLGAMFPTAVKPDAPQAGIAWLRAYLARFGHVPHLAIGGITPDNASLLAEAGCRGIAVSGCVCAAERPAEVVRSLRAVFS